MNLVTEFLKFTIEAIAILVSSTFVTYIIIRAATAAYFNSYLNFLAQIEIATPKQVKWKSDQNGTEI